jgi:hypothetical protein
LAPIRRIIQLAAVFHAIAEAVHGMPIDQHQSAADDEQDKAYDDREAPQPSPGNIGAAATGDRRIPFDGLHDLIDAALDPSDCRGVRLSEPERRLCVLDRDWNELPCSSARLASSITKSETTEFGDQITSTLAAEAM